MLTFEEICEQLKHWDEVTLLEKFDISSEELVDRFRDLIENRIEELGLECEDEVERYTQEEFEE